MKLETESKMDFDNSIDTETRFAFRKWFQSYIDSLNSLEQSMLETYISDAAVAEGFEDFILQKPELIKILKDFRSSSSSLFLFPHIKVKFQGYLFSLTGNFQGYYEGVLSWDGDIEIKVIKQEDRFEIVAQKFYPRLMARV